MTLDELVKKKILEKRKTSPVEIGNLITMSDRRLSEAFNETISNETRLVQAYQVVFTSATIALRASGYRAKSSEGLLKISEIEMTKAINSAKELYEEVRSWLGKNYPNLLHNQ